MSRSGADARQSPRTTVQSNGLHQCAASLHSHDACAPARRMRPNKCKRALAADYAYLVLAVVLTSNNHRASVVVAREFGNPTHADIRVHSTGGARGSSLSSDVGVGLCYDACRDQLPPTRTALGFSNGRPAECPLGVCITTTRWAAGGIKDMQVSADSVSVAQLPCGRRGPSVAAQSRRAT